MVKLASPGRRGQHDRTVGGSQLPGAGQAVGVQVGVGGERDGDSPPGGVALQRPQIPRRINGQGSAVTEVEQVGAVT